MAAMKEDLQGQIADVAAGTNDLAEGQIVTAASLATAHSKVHMLAEAFKTQREHIQVGTCTFANEAEALHQSLTRYLCQCGGAPFNSVSTPALAAHYIEAGQ